MNWGEIRALARTYLNDPQAKIWTNSELLKYANDQVKNLTLKSEATTKRIILQLEDGTRSYSLPDDLHEVRYVKVNGQRMFGTTDQELEELDAHYLHETGSPEWWYLEDPQTIAFYPVPSWTQSLTTFDSELGVVTQWTSGSTDFDVTDETGLVIDVVDDSQGVKYVIDSLTGAMIALDANEPVIEIVYVFLPPRMVYTTDTPDMPAYMHYGVLYGLLKTAFSRNGKGKDVRLSTFFGERYDELQKEFFKLHNESERGQDLLVSQQNVDWGSDPDTRMRIWP